MAPAFIVTRMANADPIGVPSSSRPVRSSRPVGLWWRPLPLWLSPPAESARSDSFGPMDAVVRFEIANFDQAKPRLRRGFFVRRPGPDRVGVRPIRVMRGPDPAMTRWRSRANVLRRCTSPMTMMPVPVMPVMVTPAPMPMMPAVVSPAPMATMVPAPVVTMAVVPPAHLFGPDAIDFILRDDGGFHACRRGLHELLRRNRRERSCLRASRNRRGAGDQGNGEIQKKSALHDVLPPIANRDAGRSLAVSK